MCNLCLAMRPVELEDEFKTTQSSQLISVPSSDENYVHNVINDPNDVGTTINGKPVYSTTQISDYLTEGYWSDSGRSERSFDTSESNVLVYKMDGLTEYGKSMAKYAMNTWADVADIKFSEFKDITKATSILKEADTGDAGSWIGTTISMDVGQQFNGYINTSYATGLRDKDVIKVELEAGKTYTFDVTAPYNIGAVTDSVLRVLSDKGVQLAQNDDKSIQTQDYHGRIVFTANETKEYFIEVSAKGMRTGKYALNVQEGAFDPSYDIGFNDASSGAYNSSSVSSGDIQQSNVNINSSWAAYGEYYFQTYIHEIGHALGLGHAGNYNGGASFGADALFANDSYAMSVMSYFKVSENPNYSASFRYVDTAMMADIEAIQKLYGANMTTRSGDTVYGRDAQGKWALDNGKGKVIYDAGGYDTIDLTHKAHNQIVNLQGGQFSSINGYVNTIGISETTVIEAVKTGSGNDVVYGNKADNYIMTGAGNDTIHDVRGGDDIFDGGTGSDTLRLLQNFMTYTFSTIVDAVEEMSVVLVNTLTGEKDIALNIEYFTFLDVKKTFIEIYEIASGGDTINLDPIANTDVFVTDENIPISGNVLNNDTDYNSEDLLAVVAKKITTVNGGSVDIGSDGKFTYTPATDFDGSDSFVYEVVDGAGGSSTGTVKITVNNIVTLEEAKVFFYNDVAGDIAVLDSDSLNKAPSGYLEKTLAVNFTTGSDVASTQIIYEQGASTRGLNLVIDSGKLYAAVWNHAEENWGFKELSVDIAANQTYSAIMILDGALPKNGEASLYLNGDLVDTIGGVGKLYAHDDAYIGRGDGDATLIHNVQTTDTILNFTGTVNIIGQYNKAVVGDELGVINNLILNPTSTNNAPVAIDDNFDVNEDDVAVFDLLGNDSDPDGDVLTISSVGNASHGVAVLNADNTVTYTPNSNFNGTDSFTYTISDGKGGTHTATANITINPINDNPVAVNDSFTLDQDDVLEGNVLLNDSDPDGDVLSVTAQIIETANGGRVSISANGDFTYTPANGYFGTDRFAYTLSDGNGGTDEKFVNLTVNQIVSPADPSVVDTLLSTADYLNVNASIVNKIANNTNLNAGDTLKRTHSVSFSTGSDISKTQVVYEEGGIGRGLNLVIENGKLYAAVWNNAEENWGFKELEVEIDGTTDYVATLVLDGALPDNGTASLYLNGNLVDTIDGVGMLYEHLDNIGVGQLANGSIIHGNAVHSDNGTNTLFDGVVLNVANFNSVLSASDITKLNQEMRVDTPTKNLSLALTSNTGADGIKLDELDNIEDSQKINIINTLTKTHTVSFTTGEDINTTQVIYEQGGKGRGLNLVIESGKLYAAVWNHAEENWGFKELEVKIDGTTDYVATLVLDGALPANGTASLYLNGNLVDTIDGVGMLYEHHDNIGIGEVGENTLIHDVANVSNHAFTGKINNIVQYNDAFNMQQVEDLQNGLTHVGTGQEKTIMEFGSIDIDHNVVNVDLAHDFDNPVVFAMMTTMNGSQIATVRISDVESGSFNIQIQEADYLDGMHLVETVSYIVMEQGSWTLENGAQLEVGTIDTDNLYFQDGAENVSFETGFSQKDAPALFTQVQTKNDESFVVTRQGNTTGEGFSVGLQEEELYNDSHSMETIGWFAIDTGTGTLDGFDYIAGVADDGVTHQLSDILFDDHLSELPQLIANINSDNGADPALLRVADLNSDKASLMIQEDQSNDIETQHISEAFSYFSIEGSGQIQVLNENIV